MKNIRVLITVPEIEDELHLVKEVAALSSRLTVNYHQCLTDEDTAANLENIDVLYTQRPPTHLENANRLKWVQFCFTGIDKLVSNPIFEPERQITVTNGAGAHAGPIAEYCLAAMGMLTRDFMQFLNDQREKVRDRSHSRRADLHGKTLGLVGYGHIGREVARLATAYRMKILAVERDPTWRTLTGFQWPNVGDPEGTLPERFFNPDQLHEMLPECDYVVGCVPLTPQTEKLFGPREFEVMKKSAFFINVGRGRTLDDMALAHALDKDVIAGAAVDVFAADPGPLPADHPLWTLDNILITPHISGSRNSLYFQRMNDIFCANLRRYLGDESLLNVVAPGRGY